MAKAALFPLVQIRAGQGADIGARLGRTARTLFSARDAWPGGIRRLNRVLKAKG